MWLTIEQFHNFIFASAASFGFFIFKTLCYNYSVGLSIQFICIRRIYMQFKIFTIILLNKTLAAQHHAHVLFDYFMDLLRIIYHIQPMYYMCMYDLYNKFYKSIFVFVTCLYLHNVMHKWVLNKKQTCLLLFWSCFITAKTEFSYPSLKTGNYTYTFNQGPHHYQPRRH